MSGYNLDTNMHCLFSSKHFKPNNHKCLTYIYYLKPTYNLPNLIMYEFTLLRKNINWILNLTNSVYNFNNNGSESEKSVIKTLY